MLCIFHICLYLTFIYSLRQAALAVMAVTSCSFHQASLSLLQQPFFSPSLQFSAAFSLHKISLSFCFTSFSQLFHQSSSGLNWDCCFLQPKMRLQDKGVCRCVCHAFGSKSNTGFPARTPQEEQLHGCSFCPQHPYYIQIQCSRIIFYFLTLKKIKTGLLTKSYDWLKAIV